MKGLLAGILLMTATAHAVPPTDLRHDGASRVRGAFVAIAPGARAAGMGEAFTAIADDPSAVSWNPAGMSQPGAAGVLAMYDVIAENVGLGYVALGMPVGTGTAGVSLTALSFGTYDLRGMDGLKTGVEGITDVAAVASYCGRNPGWLGLTGWTGLSVEMVKESKGATIPAIGGGGVFPVGDDLTFGWAAQHIGPATDGFTLPGALRGGVSLRASQAMRLSTDLGYLLASRAVVMAIGAEVVPIRGIALRAGGRIETGGGQPRGLSGIAAGAGVKFGRLKLDYAFQPFGELTTSHRLALVYIFDRPAAPEPEPAAALTVPPIAAPAQKPAKPKSARNPKPKPKPKPAPADGE